MSHFQLCTKSERKGAKTIECEEDCTWEFLSSWLVCLPSLSLPETDMLLVTTHHRATSCRCLHVCRVTLQQTYGDRRPVTKAQIKWSSICTAASAHESLATIPLTVKVCMWFIEYQRNIKNNCWKDKQHRKGFWYNIQYTAPPFYFVQSSQSKFTDSKQKG